MREKNQFNFIHFSLFEYLLFLKVINPYFYLILYKLNEQGEINIKF